MEEIKINEIFKDKKTLENATFGMGNPISLDFSNVKEVNIADLETLLDIQKIAFFNNNKIIMNNMDKKVFEVLEQTGIYKGLDYSSNPIKLNKRLSFNL